MNRNSQLALGGIAAALAFALLMGVPTVAS